MVFVTAVITLVVAFTPVTATSDAAPKMTNAAQPLTFVIAAINNIVCINRLV
jgi:hypothetical protein